MSRTETDPAISVVMPVHNALPYLDEAIGSILGQSRGDFEFVIYDDASTDGSAERLKQWAERDRRIRLFHGERQLGPALSSTEVVRRSTAPLIARMDADDIAAPNRLERQARVMEGRPDAGIVGSLCDVIDSEGRTLRRPEPWRLSHSSFFTPFPHGSIMFRRNVFEAIGGYRAQCAYWEDLDFVLRASERTNILVIPQSLYRWRHSDSGTRLASEQVLVENAMDLRYRAIARIQANRSYEDLLREPTAGAQDRVDPRVFVSLGALALWAGRRPKPAKRFLARARLRFDAASMIATAWVAWASLSPGSLRAFLRLISRIRSISGGNGFLAEDAVEWQPSKRPGAAAPRSVDKGVSREC